MQANNDAALASIHQAFFAIVKRDLTLAWRKGADVANPLLFFIMVITLFPLGVSPSPKILAVLAPGLLWVVALLASLLAAEALFKADFADGSLELMVLSPQPLYVVSLAKVLSHWLFSGLPLCLLAPVLAVMVHLPEQAMGALLLSLLLGTLCLSFVAAIGAALTVSLARSGVLLSLIVLPLFTPVLIFGASCVQSAVEGYGFAGQLAILAALALLALSLAPLAIAAAIRINLAE